MDNPNQKKIVLVVEDEEILARTLEDKLIGEGFLVHKASDGEDGLRLALSEHPDLILLDLLMPKVDGISMLKKLREDSWGKHATVIILTNVNDPAKVAEGMTVGLDGTYEYLVKTSWSLDDVIIKIKQKLQI